MKNKISKILGIGLTAGLVFGLIGALFAAPVSADLMKWGIVNTPSWEDLQILPASDILDYDIGGDGDTIYAVLETNTYCNGVGDDDSDDTDEDLALVRSTDGGVTWTDITDNVTGAANLPDTEYFVALYFVSVAPDDEDWLAVVGLADNNDIWVVASQDGGDNFSFARVPDDGSEELDYVFDLDVSIEVDGIRNIAVAGRDDCSEGTIFRLKAGTWLSGTWEDTNDDYLGWSSIAAVIACEFSPNFDLDDTIVCLGCDGWRPAGGQAILQSGIWESGGGSWNANAGFPGATEIASNGDTLQTNNYNRNMGLALPADYDGSDPGARAVFLFVNAMNLTNGLIGGWVFRADNNSLSPVVSPPGDPPLASIDVHGDADTGKLMIGAYYQWDNDNGRPINPILDGDCCAGVMVWHTEEIDICCVQWEGACKNPSGPYLALVMYTPDGSKQYASTSGTLDMDQQDGTGGSAGPNGEDDLLDDLDDAGFILYDDWAYATGTPLDESAFSVSRDNAVSFNQLGLIDTDIDYLSDVAVCPDCSTIYLSTISERWEVEVPSTGDYPCLGGGEATGYCNCDSVWRSYDDGDTWERVFHGDWSANQNEALLLRLPCDAIEDCCDQDPVAPSGTIYLGIQGTNQIFYSRDCGQCWNEPQATKITIQDFAVESENTVYVIDHDDGDFSMSTQYGRRWSDPVDTGLDSGHTITSCCNEGMIVIGPCHCGSASKVAWSDDGGENWNLTDELPVLGPVQVHVACDPTCENIIYAAVDPISGYGIYRTDVTDGTWTDLNALGIDYFGIAIAREGTLYAPFNSIWVDPTKDLCDPDRFAAMNGGSFKTYGGVARNLDPCETACCGTEDWDYLICGLTGRDAFPGEEAFNREPSALRICGCLTIDTNTVLYAIDTFIYYDVTDGSEGALWSYEDCAAKAGPILTSPADGAVLDCEPCAGCDAANFTLKWERMCEACSYDIQIMDADGNLIVEWVDEDIVGDPPSLFMDYGLTCGETYTWKVREANTACECVHSPWSETWSFTVTVGAADAINLLAPTKGAMDVPIENIGFSWSSVRNATSYSFVLSPNANLAGALVSQDMSTTAFNFVGPLDYSKAYYWQIIAWSDGTRLTTSSIGVFNTMAEPTTPPPPVVVEQQPAPTINIPPTQQITPTWIYVVIGVGCALAVVVIVLIVRTRRP